MSISQVRLRARHHNACATACTPRSVQKLIHELALRDTGRETRRQAHAAHLLCLVPAPLQDLTGSSSHACSRYGRSCSVCLFDCLFCLCRGGGKGQEAFVCLVCLFGWLFVWLFGWLVAFSFVCLRVLSFRCVLLSFNHGRCVCGKKPSVARLQS